MKFIYKIFILIILNPLWISAVEDKSGNDTFIFDNIEEYTAAAQKGKSSLTSAKIVLSPKRISAISLNAAGGAFLLAGVGLLSGSLAYGDYVEKNEKDYEKYKTGKNTARGLFYGSMGAFGAGSVAVAVSIPLFIEPKSKSAPKKNDSDKKKDKDTNIKKKK
jgi:hypothetical protein